LSPIFQILMMFKVYLKIAWKNITRNRVYTIINVAGLTLGICSCLVIFLVAQFEFSFDRFHPDGERIYRIVAEMRNKQSEKLLATSIDPDLAGFQQAIPGFEAKVGYHKFWEGITVPGKPGEIPRKFEGRIEGSDLPASIHTGPEYFSIFKYRWLVGNPSVLGSPFKDVLTESAARKYFGTGSLENMIGQTVI
jgi:putative ABC transport system permease protein